VLGLSAGAITRRKLAFTPVHRVKVRWNCCPFCSVTPCTLTPRHASKCTACVQKKKGEPNDQARPVIIPSPPAWNRYTPAGG